MELFVLHSSIEYIPANEEIVLTEKDFHPCHPFFIDHTLPPGSVKSIKTKGVFETTRYIRHTLKLIDALLETEGEIYIEYYRVSFDTGGYPLRPLNYLMNEISICYQDRYQVYKKQFVESVDYIWLKKLKPALPPEDLISRWSFGIVSDGRKNERILNIIGQIKAFQIPEYEILICGPSPSNELPEKVTVLDDKDLYFDTRIPISRKKNRIIEHARYNNLVIMHDRISFAKDWYTKIISYGNYFDQLCIPILDEDTQSLRVNDWQKSFHDLTLFQVSNAGKLQYAEWDRHIYADGGFMLIKKHILEKIKLNPYLNWGEMEDVDLSARLYLDGTSFCFYTGTHLLTQTHRIKVNRKSTNWLKVLIGPIRIRQYIRKNNKKIKIAFSNFLKNKIG
ncbi:MAG: hypothetical protein ABI760_18625 [Ferruginibacter sp.]